MEFGVSFLVIWLTTWDFTNNWHFFYQWNLPQEWCQWDRGSVQREPGLSENWHVPELAMIYDKSIQSFVCQGYLVFRRTDIVDWNRSKSWDLANSQQKKKRGQMSNRIDIWYIYICILYIYVCVCLFIYLFIYLFICLYIYYIVYVYMHKSNPFQFPKYQPKWLDPKLTQVWTAPAVRFLASISPMSGTANCTSSVLGSWDLKHILSQYEQIHISILQIWKCHSNIIIHIEISKIDYII